MSQPARPKNNFFMTMLWMVAVFLTFQYFVGQKKPDPRTNEQIVEAVEKQYKEIKDQAQGRSVAEVFRAMHKDGRRIDVTTPFASLSEDQILKQLRQLNDLMADMSIKQVWSTYVSKVNDNKNYSAEEKEKKKIQSELIVAHAEYKAAGARLDINRISGAHDRLLRLGRANEAKPVWNEPINVDGTLELSPKEIKALVDERASSLGRDTLVWSFFPGYQLVDTLVRMTGGVSWFSYALAALLLAISVRTIIWPLSQKQMMWARQMSQLTPLVNEIREEYKDKPEKAQEMNQKVMAKYAEYGLNPVAGCLPALMQMPLFLLVYTSMLHYRFEFQKGTFLWINPATSEATHGFIARNLGEKDYILIVIYGISMVVTALLTPISDPSNARQQRIMSISMSVLFGIMMFFWPVPSAFVLYWVFTNVLATAQSLRAYRLPLPPLVKKNAPTGGIFAGAIAQQQKKMQEMQNGQKNVPLNGNVSVNGKKSTGAPKIHKPQKKKK